MNCKTCNKYVKRLALGLAALTLATAPSFAKDVYLVAKEFTTSVGAMGTPATVVDFSAVAGGIQTYGGGQDAGGTAAVEDAGATLHMAGNAWKKIAFSYNFTPDTILEFDFKSTTQGEIHGIGFDNNDAISQTQTYALYGTQNWGIQTHRDYPAGADLDGWTHYVVSVGQDFTGNPGFMTFTLDHDSSPQNGDAFFRNVTLHEPGGAGGSPAITMWGFAEDPDGFDVGVAEGPVSSPGPEIRVDLTLPDTVLNIHVRNQLTVPVSVFIPGQLKATSPATFVDGQGRIRVRSFDAETLPSTDGTYTWTGVKEGTYLYHSGTHVQVQVQMGLYGALVVEGTSYPAVAQEAVLVYSEIDPALHAAVADGSYGTLAYPSTFDYMPRYFLINGAAYPDGTNIAVSTGDMLLRFVNAGLRTHVPTLEGGLYMSLIAEDGNLYPFPVEQYGVELPAAKTIDAVVSVEAVGQYALYDRALGLTNWFDAGGGMLTYLDVSAGAGLFELSLAGYDVAEAGVTLSVTVNRVGGSAGAASVDYATADGTATDPAYYTATAGSLSYLDGETSATFDVPIADNSVYEGDKTFSVVLSNATGSALGAQASAVVTITEDDPQPATFQFSAATYSAAEAGGILTVTVDRVGDSAGEFTVDYATADGTATTADLDYTAANGTLTFADTVITAAFDITILDDATDEGDEAFSVALSNPVAVSNPSAGAFLGTPISAEITINDDDAPAPNIAPIANGDTLETTRGGGARVIATPLIVENDEDPDCGIGSPCIDMTSVVLTTGSTTLRGGSVSYNPVTGTVTFIPKNNGWRGTDGFQYTVEDDPNGIEGDHDGVTSNVATVYINVVKAKSAVSTKAAIE